MFGERLGSGDEGYTDLLGPGRVPKYDLRPETDGLVFVDVTVSEHLAAEAFPVLKPRTYFNPTDNQAMGWSIPAALNLI